MKDLKVSNPVLIITFFLIVLTSYPIWALNEDKNDPSDYSITGFMLVNSATNEDIMPLEEGMIIDMLDYPDYLLSIRAITEPEIVGSVYFRITRNSILQYEKLENLAPYTLFGDDAGNVQGAVFGPTNLVPFSLLAIPYQHPGKNGIAGISLSLNFNVTYGILLKEIDYDLINANTDEVITKLKDEDYIYYDEIGNIPLSIRINYQHAAMHSMTVDLYKNNESFYGREEREIPYTAFGDDGQGNIYGNVLETGDYLLRFSFNRFSDFSPGTTQTDHDATGFFTIRFKIREKREIAIDGVALFNASSDHKIIDINDHQVINIDSISESDLTVVATPTSPLVKSVKFQLQGIEGHYQVDSQPPFSLFGDSNGNFLGKLMQVTNSYNFGSEHQLIVTPYSETSLQGEEGIPFIINFSLELNLIRPSYYLVNADTDTDIQEISNQTSVFVPDINNTNLTIRSGMNHRRVASADLFLAGPVFAPFKTENVIPYTLYGDDENGDYYGSILPPGSYTFFVTYFSGHGLTGLALGFNAFVLHLLEDGSVSFNLYPNPASEFVHLKYKPAENGPIRVTITNKDNSILFQKSYSGKIDDIIDLDFKENQMLFFNLISKHERISRKIKLK